MDELQRLYEHQTMMAIGIYSFLDNLLAHIPPRSENENGSVPEPPRPTETNEISRLPIRTTINEFTTGLLGLTRMETFRERQERIRLSQAAGVGDAIPETRDESFEDGESRVAMIRSDSIDLNESQPNKSEIVPGGYLENIFIYLSEREKEEFSCAVCYCILKDAYQCQNGHNFCYACIYTWSTGPTPGHDSCPVCRSDGLYAKNIDIMERINRKHVRCPETGCNWIGLLSAYGDHEHRCYSPLELDLLIADCKREKLIPIINDTRNDDSIAEETSKIRVKSELKPISTTPSDQSSTDRVPSTNVGSSPEVCAPLTDSLNPTETTRERNSTPRGLVNLRRRERSTQNRNRQMSRNPVQRRDGTTRSSSTSQTLSTPTRTRNTPLVLNSTHRASQNTVANPQLNRPAVVNRISRLNTSNGPYQVARRTGLPRRLAHRQSESISQNSGNGTQIVGTGNDHNTEGPSHSSDMSTPELEQVSESTSGSISTTESISLVDRSEPNQSSGLSVNHTGNEVALNATQTEHLSLPAIRPSNALITFIDQNNIEQQHEGSPARRQNQSPTDESMRRTNRPLEFRRLVPRRQGRVVEQLRETREQLAAMLRLMTTELEERRQHVLNVTLETASRGRLLRNLHMQRIQNLRREGDEPDTLNSNTRGNGLEDTDLIDTAQQIRFRHAQPQDNVYQADRAYYPNIAETRHQRPNLGSTSQSLLTPTFRERESNAIDWTRTSANSPDQDHSVVSSTTRLLARLRLNSLGQTNGPTLLMSRNRNISSLLPDHAPQSSVITGWSSDEDQSDG